MVNKKRGYENNGTTNKKLVNLPIIIGRIRILLLLCFAFAKQPNDNEWNRVRGRELKLTREENGMYAVCWIDMHDLRWERNEFAKIFRYSTENVNITTNVNNEDFCFKLQK